MGCPALLPLSWVRGDAAEHPTGQRCPSVPQCLLWGQIYHIPSSSRPLVQPPGSGQPLAEQGHLTSESPLQYTKLLFLLVPNPILSCAMKSPSLQQTSPLASAAGWGAGGMGHRHCCHQHLRARREVPSRVSRGECPEGNLGRRTLLPFMPLPICSSVLYKMGFLCRQSHPNCSGPLRKEV